MINNHLEDLIGRYWDIAYAEGQDGYVRNEQANEVLSDIRGVAGAVGSITVRIIHQYGNERIQPICEKAHYFCDIARARTLTRADIEKIRLLGFSVKVEQIESPCL